MSQKTAQQTTKPTQPTAETEGIKAIKMKKQTILKKNPLLIILKK